MPPDRPLISLVCAAPPTRDTEMPALMAGRMPALNRLVSRKIWPSVIEITFVGTKADETRPQTMISGDSNVSGGGGGFDPQWSVFLGTSIDAAWDKNLHVRNGNLAMADGSVQNTKTPTLRAAISLALGSGLTNVVFSKPRAVF